jgi:hypothetical protein
MNTPLDTHLQIVAGDDYKAADNLAPSWTSQMFPTNLAGATLTLTIGHTQYNLYGNLPIVVTGTVPASPASPKTITLDVAGTVTANLPAGEYDYQLDATLADGDKIAVAIGHLTIYAAPGTVPLYPPAV